MNPRPFAWTAGLLMLLIGIGGFVPGLTVTPTDPLRVSADVAHPQLVGLFGVSVLLNLIHIGLGAWGVWAGRSLMHAVHFSRRMAALVLVLAIAGAVPGFDTLFGLAPLYGNNLLLHGLLAVSGLLFGWLYRRPHDVDDLEEDDIDEDDEHDFTDADLSVDQKPAWNRRFHG